MITIIMSTCLFTHCILIKRSSMFAPDGHKWMVSICNSVDHMDDELVLPVLFQNSLIRTSSSKEKPWIQTPINTDTKLQIGSITVDTEDMNHERRKWDISL